MKYNIMKVLCMFDLPVDTEKERKAYRNFRKNLLIEGFAMMQYSIYVRTCPSREYADRLENRIKKFIPDKGNVRLLSVTEKQYNDMKILVGNKTKTEEILGVERMIII
ncbi:MAG: CRISPR-associated endonuclease Cas2 [Butyrivibrio crossotus]|nr:CRISPR-associated endonuclease Cas2 [Butyrivibrio crossotus]